MLRINTIDSKDIKRAFFLAFVVIVIAVVVGLRLYATSKLTEASGVVDTLRYGDALSCEKETYRADRHSQTYAVPYIGTLNKYKDNRTSNNLIANNDFLSINPNGQLAGFPGNESTQEIKKTVEIDIDGTKFLRSAQITSKDPLNSGWIHSYIDIQNKPYLYTFEYRSTAKSTIVLETVNKDGLTRYKSLGNLKPSQEWVDVAGHFENYSGDFVKARITVGTTSVGYVDLKKPRVIQLKSKPLEEGIVSISFDDGWKSIYDSAFPILEKHNIPSTQYINPGLSENRELTSYMSFDQVREMQSRGHEIGSHSLTHCVQTILTAEELEDDSKESAKILERHGIEGNGGFAYPFGSYNHVVNESKKKHYAYLRTSDQGYNDYYHDLSKLKAYTLEADTTLEELESWVEYAKTNNLWLILVYHNIEQNGQFNVTPEEFEEHLKLIKASGLKTMTVQDALNQVKSQN